METKYIFFILVASTLLYSCEDFFNSVTDVDIAAHESKLAVYGYMYPDRSNQLVRVGNSKGYIESETPDYIDDATVTLSKNGVLVNTFTAAGGNGMYYLGESLDAEPGDELRLDVSAPGYDPIYATESVFPEIEVTSVTYEGESFSQEYGEVLPEYEIVINDDGNANNFYAIEVWRLDTIYQERDHVYTYSNDFNLTEWAYVGLVTSDEAFNGNRYELRVHLEEYDELPNGVVYEFIIMPISENVYKYAKSYTNYINNDGNPFAEPVTVTSNMQEEGFGLFTFLRKQRYIADE